MTNYKIGLTSLAFTLALTSTVHAAPKTGDELEAADVGSSDVAAEVPATDAIKEARLAWWREARFGCFVHWGAYSQLGNMYRGKQGGGYAEHIQRYLKISQEDYMSDAIGKFNPTKFDADAWIDLVKKAGMRYFVVTAKHHDGFAMYDSQVSDYNIVKKSPWHHDPMKDLAGACAREDIAFGFYYSHAFDWGDRYAPGNDWEFENPGGDRNLLGGRKWYDNDPEKLADVRANYVDKKAIPQIRELITQYHPKLLWFDTPSKLPNSENIRILDSVRTADPSVVVNGRLVRNAGDYTNTGDRAVEFRRINGDWEAIPTTNESYGWSPLDNSYKTPDFLIRVLEKAVSRGGNILLNIGPTRDGTIDPNDVAILEGIGRWMSINSESIYGCGAAPLPTQAWGVVTAKKTTLYLHVLNWPAGPLVVGGLESTPRSAHMLTATGEIPVTYQRVNQQDLAFTLPAKPPSASPAVIRLEFDTAPQGGGVRLIDTIVATNQILAFDAELHGQHFSFGDGKQDNYTVYNWTSTDQFLTWQVRLNQPARFDVALHYGTVNGGDYTIEVSDWRATRTAPPYVGAPPRIYPTQTDSLGTVSLPAGIHTITLRANKISGKGEFIRPLELFLKSASK